MLTALTLAAMLAVPVPMPKPKPLDVPHLPPPARCYPLAKVTGVLAQQYREVPAARGLADSGALMMLYASPQGTWTIVMVDTRGCATVIGSGRGYESTRPVPGLAV